MSQFQKWTKGIVIGRTNDSKRRRKSRQELRSLRNFEDLIKREGQKERKRKTDRGEQKRRGRGQGKEQRKGGTNNYNKGRKEWRERGRKYRNQGNFSQPSED
jgi:hypothetical protein